MLKLISDYALRIANALAKAGLTFHWDHYDLICDRLRGQGLVGIVPQSEISNYAWHRFPREWGIVDCISLNWFKDENTQKF